MRPAIVILTVFLSCFNSIAHFNSIRHHICMRFAGIAQNQLQRTKAFLDVDEGLLDPS